MDSLKMQSPNLVDANIEKIAALFPNCITEDRDENGTMRRVVDFDLLRQELSASLVEGPQERYTLSWPGKNQAILTANAPIAMTLRPCREESVDFENTKNIFIEGDNLDALKLLQETYLNKIKMIYIDPPYNTGNDFIYEDDFAEDINTFFKQSNQKDEEGNRLVANTESNGRFHSDWLGMMYSRLKLARNLLSKDGIIFISIDDNEIHNLRKLCDEIFGADNFIGIFIINSSPSAIDYGHMAKMHDYALFYAKEIIETTTKQLTEENKTFKYTDEIGPFNLYPLYNGNVAFNPKTRPNLYYPFYLNPDKKVGNEFYEIGIDEQSGWVKVYPVVSRKDGIQRVWRWGRDKSRNDLNKEIVGYKTEEGEFRIVQKTRHTGKVIRSLQIDKDISTRRGTGEVEKIFNGKLFPFPKPVELIKRFASVGMQEDSIILDFFSGSATTAHSILELNSEDNGKRKFIMIQLHEPCDETSEAFKAGYKTIAEIGKERIRRAGKMIKEENPLITQNLDTGFRVFKVDTSNMKDVHYTPDELNQENLELFKDHIKSDRSPEDLLFQVFIDWGLDLTKPIAKETIDGKTVFIVDTNDLIACFDSGITEELVKKLAAHKPLRVVFRDDSFGSDSVKINVGQIFKLLSPVTEVKSI
jgi:adenine-specific DNA-methyltransferase